MAQFYPLLFYVDNTNNLVKLLTLTKGLYVKGITGGTGEIHIDTVDNDQDSRLSLYQAGVRKAIFQFNHTSNHIEVYDDVNDVRPWQWKVATQLLEVKDIKFLGAVYSSDGSQGLTQSVNTGATPTLAVKDGLITGVS